MWPDNAPMRRRDLIAAAGLLGFALSTPRLACAAQTVDGVTVDDQVHLAQAELQLNGIGRRTAGPFTAYVAALYLPVRARSADAVLAQAGPKRLRMSMLWGAPAVEFVKAFDKGVRRNASSPESVAALEPRMQRFEALMRDVGEVRKGDVVDLDYEPARGFVFRLNGRARGEPIAGADFYAALLRAFIGELPYQRQMRAGLLGATE